MADQTIDALLASLAGMGFEMDQCQLAVQAGKLTVQDAVEWILQGGQERATIPVISPQTTQTNPTLSLPIRQSTPSLAPDPLNAPVSSAAPHVVEYSPPSPTKADPDEGKYPLQDVHSRFSLDDQKRKEKESWHEKQRKQATIEAKERKLAEKKAKDQIMKEIAADREAQKNRRAQLSKTPADDVTQQEKQQSTVLPSTSDKSPESKSGLPTSCMLQIRLPTGQSIRQNFQPTSTLGELMKFVLQRYRSLSNVGFMQPFPRREFIDSDMQSTLQDLGLTPNGSLVVKKVEGGPPQKVRRENTPSASQASASEASGSQTSPSQASPPKPPHFDIPSPPSRQQFSPQHSWGKGQALSSSEMSGEEGSEEGGRGEVAGQPYMMMGEEEEGEGEEEEEENSGDEEYENIAIPGAAGGWNPPPGPGGMFGGQGGGPQHQWGTGQSLHAAGPGRGAGFGYGFGGEQQDVPNAQRAAAAAEERFERARHEPPSQRPSSSSRGLHSNIQSLTEVCIAAVAKRITSQHQHPILHLGALPLDVAERILKVMMKEGTLRPKALQTFLSCRLRHLVLDCYKYTTNELLLAVRRHTNLVHLSLASCPLINDAGLAPLTTLKKLKHLNLNSCNQLTNNIFDTIKEFHNLAILSLEGTGVGDAGVQSYVESNPRNLVNLNLNRTVITERTLQVLTALPQLKGLGLERTKIHSLQALPSLCQLQSLNISGTNLKATEMQCLRQLPALVSLNISYTYEDKKGDTGDEALQNLAGLQLNYLNLPSRHTTTDLGLQYIADMPLMSLDLTDYIHITDDGIQHIAGMTSLQKLSLCNTGITNKAMLAIQGLTNLVELELERTSITNIGAAVIGSFTKLQVLGLASTGISSKALCDGVLNKCLMLNKLNLSHTKVSDKGLAALQLPYLTLINLDSSHVTVNAIEHLRNGCPQLRVIRMQQLVRRPLDVDDSDED
ncbi:uncharacterized protein LOC144434224 [Glandiceps talaboti]